MKNKKALLKRTAISLIIYVLGISFLWTDASAEEVWPQGPETASGAAIIMEAESGAILYEKDIDHEYYPASTTKIMTALIALENSELDEIVTFSEEAVTNNEGDTSNIAREIGEEMTMEQCLYGMMLESANECAWAIAEHVGEGDVTRFFDLMNEKAVELGCEHTHFANPNGLHLDNHYTSAHDLALIAREAFKNEEFRTLVGTKSYTIPATNKHSEPTMLNNTHGMISNHRTGDYLYDGCLGGKTGYTDEANHTLVTFAKRNNMTLICVCMNALNNSHYEDTISLFDYCFDNFVTYPVAETKSLSSAAKTGAGKLGGATELFSVDEDSVVVIPKTASVMDTKPQVTPIENGDESIIGELSFTYAGRYVGGGKLMIAEAANFEYPFRNVDESEGGSSDNYYRIDLRTITLAVLTVAAVAGLIVLIHNVYPLIYRYNARRKAIKKQSKPKFKVIKRRRRRRR